MNAMMRQFNKKYKNEKQTNKQKGGILSGERRINLPSDETTGGVYNELWACEIVVMPSYKIDSVEPTPFDVEKPLWWLS